MVNTLKEKEHQEIIFGQFMKVRTMNFADGYTVFDIRTNGTDTTPPAYVTCTGRIVIPPGQVQVQVTGIPTDTKYGKQLKDCTIKEILADKVSIINYLSEIYGIGSKKAVAISDVISDLQDLTKGNGIDILVNNGISVKDAEVVIAYIRKHQAHIFLFNLLTRFGDKNAFSTASKVCEYYKEKTIEMVFNSPFDIGMQFHLPFAACDFIAGMSNSTTPDDGKRLVAAAVANLVSLTNDGDTCTSLPQIINITREKLSNSKTAGAAKRETIIGETDEGKKITSSEATCASSILIANSILNIQGSLVAYNNSLYTRQMYHYERKTANGIKRLIHDATRVEYDTNELCDYAESICGVKYAERQREAFDIFHHGGVCILTGGPGTGKTTVVKGLLVAYEKLFPDKVIKLCAPTGRASQRMKEATGREASTIHRMLEYTPYGDSFSCKNDTDQIEADLIIVDESSMISVDLSSLLFTAVKSGTTVLLVGDTAQLPSVGAGNVLADIIHSKICPVYALNKTQRQGAGSPIIENAHRIQAGNHKLMATPDFQIMECDEKDFIYAIQSQYLQYYDPNNPFAVQVLTTTRENRFTGCTPINYSLQMQINPPKGYCVHYGSNTFAINDKIMMTNNNYGLGYFNGDIGKIVRTSSQGITVNINEQNIEVPTNMLCDMTLAYATTIHKSQGSEYDVCIIAVPPTPARMLQRNILYTGITRAKKSVILIATEKTIFRCVNTVSSTQRYTKLCEMLQEKGYIYAN